MGRHKRSHKTSSVQQQGRRKASGHLDRRKKKETDGRAQKQQRKKQQQLPENPRIPSSTTEQKLSSVNLLEDSSDDEDKPTDYELLLSTFKPLTKKPRLTEGGREKIKDTTIRKSISGGGEEGFHVTVQEGWGGGVIEEGEGLAGSAGDEDSCSGDDRTDEVAAGIDPFCERVDQDLNEEEVEQLKKVFSQPLSYRQEEHPTLGLVSTATCLPGRDTTIASCSTVSWKRLHVKQRLVNLWSPAAKIAEVSSSTAVGARVSPKLSSSLQESLFAIMNSYKDLLFTCWTFASGEEIRRTYLLHALNHVLKTRSRVLKNNAKLARASKEGKSDLELRDQGLTRPKVLIVLPFREAALRTVNMIISLLLPPGEGQVSHRKRFLEEFSEEEHLPPKVPKPASYQELFSGNVDDCFRMGVAIKRNTVRLYTKFYSSDIIIASPLGLRTIIGAEGEKNRDYDFLSSLELVIVDQADVYLMQNWDHLLHLFSHLHLQPRDSHGTDFSRVRMWSLNGLAHFYRQTLVFSSFPTPEINSLFNAHCHNYAGKVKVCELRYPGSIAKVALQLPQTFHRVQCESHLQLPQARWTYFIEKVLPEFSGELMKQTAIFIPSYFDYVRLRNHMKREEMNFVPLSEHTSSSDVSRGRSHFFHGHTHFLLYTERMHFFKRYHIRGIRHLIFYSLPTYCEFYSELVNMLEGAGQVGGVTCTVLYSTYDALALSRIVGTARAAKMVKSSEHIQTLISGT